LEYVSDEPSGSIQHEPLFEGNLVEGTLAEGRDIRHLNEFGAQWFFIPGPLLAKPTLE